MIKLIDLLNEKIAILEDQICLQEQPYETPSRIQFK